MILFKLVPQAYFPGRDPGVTVGSGLFYSRFILKLQMNVLVFSPEPDSTLFPPLCVHFSRASQLIPVNTRSRILAWRLITEIANRLRRRYASSLSPEPRQSIKINILIRPVKAFCTVSRLGNTHASELVLPSLQHNGTRWHL